MLSGMTGFASREARLPFFGKICVELRSSNHKFLETVFHLPEGFLSLEDRIKKEIEAKIKRGRVTCVINIRDKTSNIFINKQLIKNYILTLKNIKDKFRIKDEIHLDTLIHLPGVLSVAEDRIHMPKIWPHLKILVNLALCDLVKMRKKEGKTIQIFLKNKAHLLKVNLDTIKLRFKKVVKDKLAKINNDEERISFLKQIDITEETERLIFHINSFKNNLFKSGPAGKELDFIAQEMQREANTIGSKSCDASISSCVIQIKSQIEKIREQLQNVE